MKCETILAAMSAAVMLVVAPAHAESVCKASHPAQLEHIAVWTADIDRTARFLQQSLGWKRHPLQFGVDENSEEFGGMKLAFVDANGIWLELVQPTTPGPGMDFLKEKGNGALVELDFSVPDFDKNLAAMKARGIDLVGMDGKPIRNGGLLSEWFIKDGKKARGNERLSYFPLSVSHGTSIEMFWEYPSGVVLRRDATWTPEKPGTPGIARATRTVVLAKDLDASANVYTDLLKLASVKTDRGVRADWLGVGDASRVWVTGNCRGFEIEVVAPPAGKSNALIKKYGEGNIMELGVEVDDIDALYARMKARGITMTDGDGKPLSNGARSVAMNGTGERYSYFPTDKSEGMRIMVYQRNAPTSGPQPH
jgi:catechol 2,3-dioxygenase-like lactoylglutathione lyase family enzyme